MEMPGWFERYYKTIQDWIASHEGVAKPIAGMEAQNVLSLLKLIEEMAEALERITTSDVPMNEGWKVGYRLVASEALRKFTEWK